MIFWQYYYNHHNFWKWYTRKLLLFISDNFAYWNPIEPKLKTLTISVPVAIFSMSFIRFQDRFFSPRFRPPVKIFTGPGHERVPFVCWNFFFFDRLLEFKRKNIFPRRARSVFIHRNGTIFTSKTSTVNARAQWTAGNKCTHYGRCVVHNQTT